MLNIREEYSRHPAYCFEYVAVVFQRGPNFIKPVCAFLEEEDAKKEVEHLTKLYRRRLKEGKTTAGEKLDYICVSCKLEPHGKDL